METATRAIDPPQRRAGALMAMFIGDALAMPVHWYYERRALAKDYGHVTGYLTPRKPPPRQHPVALQLPALGAEGRHPA